MKRIAIFVAIIAALSGCTQTDKATQTLVNAGYKNVEITGWRPFMAGKDDTFSTGFRATAPNGATVTGAVTGGFLKGNTIRVD